LARTSRVLDVQVDAGEMIEKIEEFIRSGEAREELLGPIRWLVGTFFHAAIVQIPAVSRQDSGRARIKNNTGNRQP